MGPSLHCKHMFVFVQWWVILRVYATESFFAVPGPHTLRPWMLPYHHEYGLRETFGSEPRKRKVVFFAFTF